MTRYLTIIVLVYALSSSCATQANKNLNKLDSLLNTKPDSVLYELGRNPESYQVNRKTSAKYSLLKSIALDKCYIDTSDLSIIEPAIHYYSNHGSKYDRMRSHYYLGRVQENGGDYQNALLTFQKARSYTDSTDYQFKGLIYSSIGDLFNLRHNNQESLEYMQRALDCLIQTGNQYNIAKGKYGLAIAYHNLKLYTEADSLLSEICSVESEELTDLDTFTIPLRARNIMSQPNPSPSLSIALYERLLDHDIWLQDEDMLCYCYSLFMNGEREKAQRLLKQLDNVNDEFKCNVWRYKIAMYLNDRDSALSLLLKIRDYEDEYISEQLSQSLYKSQRDNSVLAANYAAQQKDKIKYLSWMILSFCLLAFTIIFLFIEKSRQSAVKENERLLSYAEDTSRILQETTMAFQKKEESYFNEIKALKDVSDKERERFNTVTIELRKSYISLFRKQFEQISSLIDPSTPASSPTTHRLLYRSVDDLMECLSNPSLQKQLEDKLNSELSDVITSIRKDMPKLDDDDIRFICYMIMGFDNTSLSVLMNISRENVRVKRHRLKARIISQYGENHIYSSFLS